MPGWTGRRSRAGLPHSGGMDVKKTAKIAIGIVVVVVVVAAIAIAAGGSDDYDYKSQAQNEIDKYGYDAEVQDGFLVEKGVNGFGVSIIKVSGTFVSDGETHEFVMTTYTDHELATLEIDGYMFWGDDIGKAAYNYTLQEIGPFQYESLGMTFTEAPSDGMTFVLATITVENRGHEDGLSVMAPQFENSLGNLYSQDWSATDHHDSTYSDLSLTDVGLGNKVTYNLVFEVPEGTADGKVVWSNMDIDLYGYVLDPGLEPA